MSSCKIFKSLSFSSIPEKLLITLIQMNEIQVWDHVIKWGLNQKDDFNALKITLQGCIPPIRFYNLTLKEFSDKIELYKNLLKTYLSPNNKQNYKSKPDSKIITYRHIELMI